VTQRSDFTFNAVQRARFTERLAALAQQRASAQCRAQDRTQEAVAGALKPAAVCLILTNESSVRLTSAAQPECTLILTRRSPKLNAHAGQFAFPGGRIDAGETTHQAALREAHEEVGATLDASMILGELDPYATRSGYLITPVVLWAPGPLGLVANPQEVAKIFHVPLAEVAAIGTPEFVQIPESPNPVIRYPMLGTKIHAPTAALLYQLMEVCVYGRLTNVAQLEQPVWAWR
jgi:8-oxo-dGTP pyrophosphatase MutT (NUDIX family)